MISTQVAGLFGAWLGSLVLRRFFVERRPNALRAASALMLVALALTFSLKALGFSGAAALAALALAFLTGPLYKAPASYI